MLSRHLFLHWPRGVVSGDGSADGTGRTHALQRGVCCVKSPSWGRVPNVYGKDWNSRGFGLRLHGRDEHDGKPLVGVRPDECELAEVEVDRTELARVPFAPVHALVELERDRLDLVPVSARFAPALQGSGGDE